MKKTIIVLASNNAGKATELTEMMPDGYEFVTQKSLGVKSDPEENGNSYAENALIKAKATFKALKEEYSVLADDSGLEVEAIDNAPGIYSARYAGEKATDKENVDKLLSVLKGITNRKARFVCHLTLIDKDNITDFEGYVYGQITNEPVGDRGFGYDPVFVADGYNITLAQMNDIEKNKISHRREAAKLLSEYLKSKN